MDDKEELELLSWLEKSLATLVSNPSASNITRILKYVKELRNEISIAILDSFKEKYREKIIDLLKVLNLD